MIKDYYTKNDSSKALYLVLIMQIALSFFLALVNLSTNFLVVIIQYVLSESIFIGAFLYLNKKNHIKGFDIIGIKKKVDWLSVIICIFISCLVLFATYHFFGYIDELLIKIGFKAFASGLVLDSWLKFIVSAVILAGLPAFCEELIYRGIVLKGLQYSGKIKAIILSAIFFAIMHMGVFQLFYQLYLAIIFAVVFVITQDIKLSMIMHFMNNFLVLLFLFLQTKYNFMWFFTNPISFWITLVMFILSSALIVLLLYIIKKRNQKQITASAKMEYTSLQDNHANIAMVITALIYGVLLILNSLI